MLSWVLLGSCVAVAVGLVLLLWLSRHNVASVAPARTGQCDELVEDGFGPCPQPAVEHLGGRDRCVRHAELYRYDA
jgi:protein-S-isoprenylcysteine O-methyltransferase Ste14